MFYFQENHTQKERLRKLFKKIQIVYGTVPPQMEFLGNIDADYLEEFLKSVIKIMKHPHIDPDLFGFLRLYVAFKEDYPYCKNFNTKLLLGKGYSQEQLNKSIQNIVNIPLDDKHQFLGIYAIKAIYDSKQFTPKDFDTLYDLGWTQKDIFDAIEHAGTIFRNGRILTAYSSKENR